MIDVMIDVLGWLLERPVEITDHDIDHGEILTDQMISIFG